MDTKPTVRSLVLRGAFMMTPVKELHFKDGTTDKLNCGWDDLPPYVQENWVKLGNMLEAATTQQHILHCPHCGAIANLHYKGRECIGCDSCWKESDLRHI